VDDSPAVHPGDASSSRPARPAALLALAVLLFAETAVVLALVAWELLELFTARPDSYATAFALLALGVIAVGWGLATGLAALRSRGWIRASAVTWQVLQLAVAVGCFQGLYARPDVGWALLLPAIAGILLAVSKPVVRATSREHESAV